ncbi:hemerythrin domain-containing protein [Kribbella antibiotica]|uniref:Hemerythrin domain-containing protein n=1 Tax=Kribbella antibiotica TaxID=190195 RepID=A0A4R4YSW7_9ACTN|nr:hemerythrin domain-containing protein [Kribbella antibiotica]TDD46682.1 hemerythrin domain-containing protein [Kribbella antibiotica]
MTERETTRLVAWSNELRQVHLRIRDALEVTRQAVRDGTGQQATRDLLLYCHGFCAALDGHHRGEDRALFPAIEAAHPDLAPVLRALEQDHSMISHLLQGLRQAVERSATPDELDRHLEGVAAIMENHFRYEEKQLLTVLENLELDAAVKEVFGPL